MTATSRRSCEASFEWSVVKKFLDHTTPSARTNEASRLFLIVQPPLLLLRRGANCCNFQTFCARPLSGTMNDARTGTRAWDTSRPRRERPGRPYFQSTDGQGIHAREY